MHRLIGDVCSLASVAMVSSRACQSASTGGQYCCIKEVNWLKRRRAAVDAVCNDGRVKRPQLFAVSQRANQHADKRLLDNLSTRGPPAIGWRSPVWLLPIVCWLSEMIQLAVLSSRFQCVSNRGHSFGHRKVRVWRLAWLAICKAARVDNRKLFVCLLFVVSGKLLASEFVKQCDSKQQMSANE